MRTLGFYLTVLSAYQLVLYSFLGTGGPFILLDPRAGIAFFLQGRPITAFSSYLWVERATALWLLVIGLAVLIRKTKMWLRVYIVSELILAAPTVLVLVVFGPHGLRYAPGYVLAVSLVCVVFTVLPLYLTIGLLRSRQPA